MPYATNGGVDIYYEVHGAGPGLVFAHGAGGNAASWWQQVPVFESSHCIVVFDHRGFARSPCLDHQRSALHFEDDLIAVMNAAGILTATVVCQSMGGWTGVRTAVNHSERIDGVMLANTPGAIQNQATVDNEPKLRELVAQTGLMQRAISGEFSQRYPGGRVLYQQIAAFNTGARPNVFDGDLFVTPQAVRDSKVPFLVLASELDPLFPSDVLKAVAADIGAPFRLIEGAGHSTYFERPNEFNDALKEFLK